MQVPVSVLIPALNEAENIEECLRSVSWADEVVVVDSGSTDRTAELAGEQGARVVLFKYSPGGIKKKNWALQNVEFRNDWVLILDSDERVTPELAEEIAAALRQAEPGVAGYYVNRRFYFLGRWIRHAGYYPSWNLRLFRAKHGQFELVPDLAGDTGDNEVHEHLLLDGKARHLRQPLEHYAFPTVSSFVEKHNRYSSWESNVGGRHLAMTGSAGRLAPNLRVRRWLKRVARAFPFPHVSRFVYHYVLRCGFLDGLEGYVFCHLLAEYEFQIWAKTVLRTRGVSAKPGIIAPTEDRSKSLVRATNRRGRP